MTTLLDKYPAPDKERAQLLWVAHMNGLKAQAEEVVVREVVRSSHAQAVFWVSCKCGQSEPFRSIRLYSTGRWVLR